MSKLTNEMKRQLLNGEVPIYAKSLRVAVREIQCGPYPSVSFDICVHDNNGAELLSLTDEPMVLGVGGSAELSEIDKVFIISMR